MARIELTATRWRVYLHLALTAVTISLGIWLTIYGGPNVARTWYPEHPVISVLGSFSFAAWLLNILQMLIEHSERKGE